MAELTPKQRLQPSLLDRLTDDEPDRQQESRDKRVLSLNRLKAAVLRDLSWLLNSSALSELQDLDAFPLVGRSVINYGIRDLSGTQLSGVDLDSLERMLRQAILDFEPRILRDSVQVRAAADDTQLNHNALTFEIEGELWAQPVPTRIYVKTELDLEVGDVTVSDSLSGRS